MSPSYPNEAAKAEELSWDAFPAVTPEIATWKPEQDSIPTAGGLPDPRFQRGPFAGRQKQSVKREKPFGLAMDRLSEGSSTSSRSHIGSVSASRWPPHESRAAGLQVAAWLTPTDAPATMIEAPSASPKAPSDSTFEASSSSEATGSATMETFFMQPLIAQYPTPPASCILKPTDLSDNPTVPAWARSLEPVLRTSSTKLPLPTRSTPMQDQHVAQPPISTPPHLRKHRKEVKATSMGACSSFSFNYLGGSSQDGFKEKQYRETIENAVKHEPKPTPTVKDIQQQKSLLESLIPGKLISSSHAHERYLRIKLISVMESEMDTQNRTTRRELRAMNDKEFERHFDRVVSMHKLAWNPKSGSDEIDELN